MQETRGAKLKRENAKLERERERIKRDFFFLEIGLVRTKKFWRGGRGRKKENGRKK